MSTRARKTWGAGALVALAAAFLALTIVVTFALRGARLDLTASRTFDGRIQLLEYVPAVLAGPPEPDQSNG